MSGERRRRVVHASAFATVCAVVLVLFASTEPSLDVQLLALALPVAALGLPHGALDLEIARVSWSPVNRPFELVFVTFYVALGGLVIVLWWLAPGVALGAFLAYSCVHFSDDWRADMSRPARLAAGTLAVTAPILFHTDDVAAIFAALAPEASAAQLARAGATIGLVALLSNVIALAHRRETFAALELGTIVAIAWGLPPLVYFTLYFCLLHSPRHFERTAHKLGRSLREAARLALLPSLVTVLVACVVGVVLVERGAALDRAVIATVFVGLAALTVPHMVLVERFR